MSDLKADASIEPITIEASARHREKSRRLYHVLKWSVLSQRGKAQAQGTTKNKVFLGSAPTSISTHCLDKLSRDTPFWRHSWDDIFA
jgi:hypothetical protein